MAGLGAETQREPGGAQVGLGKHTWVGAQVSRSREVGGDMWGRQRDGLWERSSEKGKGQRSLD